MVINVQVWVAYIIIADWAVVGEVYLTVCFGFVQSEIYPLVKLLLVEEFTFFGVLFQNFAVFVNFRGWNLGDILPTFGIRINWRILLIFRKFLLTLLFLFIFIFIGGFLPQQTSHRLPHILTFSFPNIIFININ